MRAGLIGCGAMARHHASAMRSAGVELVAIADVRPEALQKFAEHAPGARPFASATALLADGPYDLVVISTTAPSHAALCAEVAASGVPRLFCEKPMACSLAEARAMIDACAAAGTQLQINHTRRFSPPLRALRQALADGVIGAPVHYGICLGGGRLGCNATHMVDLVRMLSGAEVVSVTGWLDPHVTQNPRGAEFWDPGGHAVMQLSNGARLMLDMMEDIGVQMTLQIVGRHGTARIQDVWGSWELLARRPEDRSDSMWGYGKPLHPVELDLLDLAGAKRWHDIQPFAYEEYLAGAPPACTGEDGYQALEAVMAIHLSDRRGHQPVALPLEGDDLAVYVKWT